MPLKQIQEWLGHGDFSTTANILYPPGLFLQAILRSGYGAGTALAGGGRGEAQVADAGIKNKLQQPVWTAGANWRSGWDSNPRAVARKLISSHFPLMTFGGN